MRMLAAKLLRWLAETLVRLYYPRRIVEGLQHLPAGGPALYVANHPNGLLDPLVLRVCIGRRARFLAKSTLWGNPFGRLAMDAFQCLPVYRRQDLGGHDPDAAVALNEESFARCRSELAAGAELALYPEGASHSDPHMRPLKTGAARIALSAAGAGSSATATGRGRGLTLVPVGSYYEDKARFRSGVHLVVGEPIELARYQMHFSADARTAIEQLTDEIRARLRPLVLRAEAGDLLNGISDVAGWTGNDPGEDGPHRRVVRAQELSAAYERLQAADPEKVARLTRVARHYARTLERLGVDDPWAVDIPRITVGGIAAAVARAVLLAPVAAWGALTSWPAYRLSGAAAQRVTKQEDEDVLSTMKMIGGAAFLTGAWIVEAIVIGWRWGLAWASLSLVVAPAASYGALRMGESLGEVAEAIRHFGWRGHGGATARRLLSRRRRLADELVEALRGGEAAGGQPT